MQFINLTPHRVVVIDGPVIEPSGEVARVAQSYEQVGNEGGVPLFRTVLGQVEGLPDPQPGVMYVVSGMVRAALPHRSDLASPGQLVRDDQGRVTGCRGLIIN